MPPFDPPFGEKLGVRTRDHRPADPERRGQRAGGWQPFPGRQPAVRHRLPQLGGDLRGHRQRPVRRGHQRKSRSAFAHSVNYRSAVVFGTATRLTDPAEHQAALRTITDHLIPGRWDTVRPPTRKELAATATLAVPLAEASVKVRTGPPADEPADVASGTWAGVVPVSVTFGEPVPDAAAPGAEIPAHIRALTAAGH